MSSVRHFISLALVLFLAAACTPKKSTIESLGGEEFLPGIFSNRPQNPTQFIAIVKLKSPALLTTVGMENGKRTVDADLAKQIEVEQTEAIADLKKLSPEIKVLFRYKMVLNGLAIVAPISVYDQLKLRMHVAYTEKETPFSRPIVQQSHSGAAGADLVNRNSIKFIGADKVHNTQAVDATGASVAVNGAGLKVGIIDTGIDYTHAMFGGAGTEEAFKAVKPSEVDPGFPTKKVVGGIDLVGTEYDSGSGDYAKHIPLPDANPMDEGGHGSHVAGTVAGIGDNVETYSGVAPKADLYAIKVFGADGSTGDAVVVAALEYSADPNADGDLKDQLDVVNMSLGSSYGNPHVLYSEAIKNLVRGGTLVVASAGNSGNFDYIVGAPSIVDEAISVAAGVDDMFHNWKFGAIKFSTPSAGDKLAELIEGPVSKPVAELGDVKGPLVHVGLLDKDLDAATTAALKGKVALIDRGVVTFPEKMKRAVAAGAIGAIVANNQDSAPISMGSNGEEPVAIPAVMITKALGAELKEQMKSGEVVVTFKTPELVEKPQLIDTLTGFSSKGPRSIDGLMKPEITAPGANVISAAMGKGSKGVKFSGTSMSAPHIAGVVTLLKQAHPDLTPAEIKSILMGTAKSIADENGKNYLLSRQGAGRVQSFEAVKAQLVADKGALSLGELALEGHKTVSYPVTLRNITAQAQTYDVSLVGDAALTLLNAQSVTLAAGESKTLVLKLDVNSSGLKDPVSEINGMITFSVGGQSVHRVPVLGIAKKISRVVGKDLSVKATSDASSAGALTELTLQNLGVNEGLAMPFNLLGQDLRKLDPHNSDFMSKACDLQAVGYRLVNKVDKEGKAWTALQVGVKTYEPMTTWNACEVSVLIDANDDKVADQELAAIPFGNLKGLSTGANDNVFASILLDAAKVRDLRKKYEEDTLKPLEPNQSKPEEDYSEAVIDMQPMAPLNNSTVVVVEANVSKLLATAGGHLSIRVATIFNEASAVEMDDYLGSRWLKVSLNEAAQSYKSLPESISIAAGASSKTDFTRGEGKAPLMLLMPHNRSVTSGVTLDDQLQILKANFAK